MGKILDCELKECPSVPSSARNAPCELEHLIYSPAVSKINEIRKNLNIVAQPPKGTTVINAFVPLRHPSDAVTPASLEPREMLHALAHHSPVGHRVNPCPINGSDNHTTNCRAVGEMDLSCASDPIACPLPTNEFIPSFPSFTTSNLPTFNNCIPALMRNIQGTLWHSCKMSTAVIQQCSGISIAGWSVSHLLFI